MNNLSNRLPNLIQALVPVVALVVLAFILKAVGVETLVKSGEAIIDNLGLILALSLAYGLTENGDGAAALAGAVGFFVLSNVSGVINAEADVAILGGITVGIVAGLLYNKFHNIKLPEFLGFFAGRRFVPIVTSFAAVAIGLVFGNVM